LDELRHKIEVLERHCAEIGRDSSAILRTVMVPVVLVADHRDDAALLERLTSERRAITTVATPEEAVEFVQPYLDLGFRGIILRNPGIMTPEAIGLAGEMIGLVRGATVPA
jgi:alkanesulfonate monooxygenase SsuD/methylene tetrahydromethanopterin reductase-like flavin-dependent oxidoreductase (luciferase family)